MMYSALGQKLQEIQNGDSAAPSIHKYSHRGCSVHNVAAGEGKKPPKTRQTRMRLDYHLFGG